MLNVGYKKEALGKLEKIKKSYEEKLKGTMESVGFLHNRKIESTIILKRIEDYIMRLRNRPYEYEKEIEKVRIRRQRFETDLKKLEIESKKFDKVSGSVVSAGVATGAGVAAFGPTAALAVATTFGTASTGTAIATLSGAAATNAALAWLGGGAIVAGGGGMAAGETLLALAGPVGWAIGGVALAGGGLLANSKNKKIAQKAEKSIVVVKEEITKLKKIDRKILVQKGSITSLNEKIENHLTKLLIAKKQNFEEFSEEDRENIKILMNCSESLSEAIGEVIA